MEWSSWAVAALVASVAASGCSGPTADEGAGDPDIVVITDPSENRTRPDLRPHLHDYWGGAHRLTIMDEAQEIGGILWFGDPIPVASFRPETGFVVPQGAAWVNVTVSWEDTDDANTYQDPQLWVKSAADNSTVLVANLTGPEPQTVAIPSLNSMNDLPHQVLSAWQFDLVMAGTPMAASTPATPDGQLQFTGVVQILVTADRGLEIPLYPGHPDRWGGANEIQLLEAGGQILYDGDPTTGNWRCYSGCPVIHVPDDGVVVPFDADHVLVTLELTYGAPSRLGLKVHGADSRDYTALVPQEDGTNSRTYLLPVLYAGDGPYAQQSQWEFAPFVEGPVENGFVFEEYSLTATAYRGP